MDYGIDLKKPIQILEELDNGLIRVQGTGRVMQTSDGEFGGVPGTWVIAKEMLLTNRQRQTIKNIRNNLSPRVAERLIERIYDAVIAERNAIVAR